MQGSRLRATREHRNITQAELSELVGVGEKEIWRYENDKTKASAETVGRIAHALSVSSDFLLGLTDDYMPLLSSSDLRPTERAIIAAVRRGDKIEAIKKIVS